MAAVGFIAATQAALLSAPESASGGDFSMERWLSGMAFMLIGGIACKGR
jgi:hypothetical protein